MNNATEPRMSLPQRSWVSRLNGCHLEGWDRSFVASIYAQSMRFPAVALTPKQALWVGKLIIKHKDQLDPRKAELRHAARCERIQREWRYHRAKHG